MAAEVDLGAEIAEIMVAEKQNDIVGMGMLEFEDIAEVVQDICEGEAFVALGIKVVSEKNDILVLLSLYGLLPEGAAVDVWYDDHSCRLGFA